MGERGHIQINFRATQFDRRVKQVIPSTIASNSAQAPGALSSCSISLCLCLLLSESLEPRIFKQFRSFRKL